MTDENIYEKLNADGVISNESLNNIKDDIAKGSFSVYWEVKTVLYIGILLLTSGLGIAVYKNINSIGHEVILAFLGVISVGCLIYCFKNKHLFSKQKVKPPSTFFEYILLLGTLSTLIFIGYIQFQYNIFGVHYGLATFIPMLLLFYIAYDFDHLGILNMAIVNLALWMGVVVTPRQLLSQHTFNNQHIINIYAVFGLLLFFMSWLTSIYKLKLHFMFSYTNYAIYVTLTAMLAGYFFNYNSGTCWLWMFALLLISGLLFYYAFLRKSFYFVLIAATYAYIGISSIIIRGLFSIPNGAGLYFVFYYFIGSAIGLIIGLIELNKKMHKA